MEQSNRDSKEFHFCLHVSLKITDLDTELSICTNYTVINFINFGTQQ